MRRLHPHPHRLRPPAARALHDAAHEARAIEIVAQEEARAARLALQQRVYETWLVRRN